MAEKSTVVVIGAGTAGNACARYLARREWRVIEVERGRMGGTCTWRGCIPKKSLYRSASVVRLLRDSDRFGILAEDSAVDWQSVLAWKWHAQETYAGDQAGIAAGYGIEVLHDAAKFMGPDTVAVGDRTLKADHLVIATGSETVLPQITGIELADTSDDALRYPQLPESLLIVGGGFIAMEMAGIYASFGTRVSLVARAERVLEMLDPELATTAVRHLETLGVRFLTGSSVIAIEGSSGALTTTVRAGDGSETQMDAQRVLMATGRRPSLGDLDIDAAGVRVDASGHLVLDEYLRTTNPHVWAAGDAAGGMMQTPVANLEGRTVGRSIDEGVPAHPDCSAMPITCFTVPQLATVGQTEQAARDTGIEVSVTKIGLGDVGANIVDGETDGFLKLISDAATGKIIGAQVASPVASDIIYAAAVALHGDYTAEQLGEVAAVHPSHAEVLYYAGG